MYNAAMNDFVNPDKPVWTADFDVTLDLVISLIESQFPQLAPVMTTPFDEGWDNAMFLVNEKYLFRFPRRKVAIELLEREIRALPLIAPQMTLPVPNPEFIGEPTEFYPCPFSGYCLLEGRAAAHAEVDETSRINAAEPLGKFLKKLHQLPVEPLKAIGLGSDTMNRLNIENRVPRTHLLLDMTSENSLIEDRAPYECIINSCAIAPPNHELIVVHGDFHIKNILIGEDGVPSGVIDWGDIHLGHPATDLSLGCAFLPPQAHQRFLDTYGGVDEVTWRMAIFRALYITLVLLDYGHGIGDEALIRETQKSLDSIVEAEAAL